VESSSTIPSLGEIGLAHFVPYLLNRISACWNANLQEALKDLDMTTTKMRILAILSVMPGLTINELSVHAITEQSTMSRTLDALEEQNYIRRQARADDMRVREIYITEDGRLLFARIWPPMYEMYSHLFEGIDWHSAQNSAQYPQAQSLRLGRRERLAVDACNGFQGAIESNAFLVQQSSLAQPAQPSRTIRTRR
jgi:DNA-binding MarR family transcriptional regulator